MSRKTPVKAAAAEIALTPYPVTGGQSSAGDKAFPSVIELVKRTATLLGQHRRLLFGITLVYGALYLVLVDGLGGGASVPTLKATIVSSLNGHISSVAASALVFSQLISTGGAGGNSAPAYQFLLMIIASLAMIWALRQLIAGNTDIGIRDAYYRGMYPLVPFMIIVALLGVQLIPLIIGSSLYTLVISHSIAVGVFEIGFFAAIFAGLGLITLYLFSSTVMALYIVTLPDMSPSAALQEAKRLVRHRRAMVFRKVAFLPVVMFLIAVAVMMPAILFAPGIAQWLFFLITISAVLIVHSYMYTLYLELAHETD